MHLRIIKVFVLSLAVLLLTCLFAQAKEITGEVEITGLNSSLICDANLYTHDVGENFTLTFNSPVSMQGVYIEFNSAPKGAKINNKDIFENGYLHEYLSLDGVTQASIYFDSADICNVYVYDNEPLPENVQQWQEPTESGVDLLLLATHSDDDQLFFAGLLPLYASRENTSVAVAYFANHYDTYNRTHELLNGLWHCGVRVYPEISPFPDGYSESAKEAAAFLETRGFDKESVNAFHALLLEKYKPQIVVLHDFNGEYGHGAHMHATESFTDFIASYNGYLPKKVYVHLYKENPIVIDIDTPSDTFGGKSAFNVSQEAFKYHKSQHWTWFYDWIYGKNNDITSSSQINKYNPAQYGLYYTLVGADTQNDMFENIITYEEERLMLEKEHLLKEDEKEQVIITQEDKNIVNEKEKTNVLPSLTISFVFVLLIVLIIFTKGRKK